MAVVLTLELEELANNALASGNPLLLASVASAASIASRT
jgi:hypothetical protein